MNTDAIRQGLAAHLRERADQPLGDAQLVSDRALAPFSDAGMTAAENLLIKAVRALADGAVARAERFIDRAAALNYDHRERTAPAAYTAGMMLFNAVVDALEDSPADDSHWLDAAVAVMSSSRGWGQAQMRHVLLVVQKDYVVEAGESRAITAAVAGVPERIDLSDTELPPAELAEAVRSVLETVRAYESRVVDMPSR